MPGLNDGADPDLAYVFMTLAHSDDQGQERDYRQVRASMLESYCYAVLQDNRHLGRVVGIATDKPAGPEGISEDLLALEVSQWTPELEEEVTRRRAVHEVLVEGRLVHRHEQGWEYPPQTYPNRQQRRPAERRATKAARRGF